MLFKETAFLKNRYILLLFGIDEFCEFSRSQVQQFKPGLFHAIYIFRAGGGKTYGFGQFCDTVCWISGWNCYATVNALNEVDP